MVSLCRCGKSAPFRCADCGKPRCTWHTSGRPVLIGGVIGTETVCSPGCKYDLRPADEWHPK